MYTYLWTEGVRYKHIFGKLVYLILANIVAFGCIHFASIKIPFSIFLSASELYIFLKKLPKIHSNNGQTTL